MFDSVQLRLVLKLKIWFRTRNSYEICTERRERRPSFKSPNLSRTLLPQSEARIEIYPYTLQLVRCESGCEAVPLVPAAIHIRNFDPSSPAYILIADHWISPLIITYFSEKQFNLDLRVVSVRSRDMERSSTFHGRFKASRKRDIGFSLPRIRIRRPQILI